MTLTVVRSMGVLEIHDEIEERIIALFDDTTPYLSMRHRRQPRVAVELLSYRSRSRGSSGRYLSICEQVGV